MNPSKGYKMNTDALNNLFNWIALTLGIDMFGSEMTARIMRSDAAPDLYRDVQFKITHDDVNGVEAEADFRLLHALVIALEPRRDVTIGVVEYCHPRYADLVIQLNGVLLGNAAKRPADLSSFQTLAIKRLGGFRPYENSPNMHRDQGK
jgi:hypothetical protein